MDLRPKTSGPRPSVEEKLGFDVVRARLRSYLRSELGVDRLGAMRTASSLSWLQGELQRIDELKHAFEYDDSVPLDHVTDIRETLKRAKPQDAFVAPGELHELRLVLVTLRRLKRYMRQRKADYPALHDAATRITPLKQLEEQIRSVINEEGSLRDNASNELLRLRRRIVQQQGALREQLQRSLRKAIRQGYATEERPTMRAGRMVIPVRAEAKRKVEGFVHDSSATGQTVYIEPTACLDLNNEVRELQAEERREVERILRETTSHVRRNLSALETNISVLAQFDLLQAKAHLARELDAVVPETVSDEGIIDLHGGINPVLLLHFRREAARGEAPREVVPVAMKLGKEHRTLVITGPNAGGKTVAMKTVGLFALMLAYGLPIPVEPHTRFDLFEQLIADIGDEQSIEEDLSTFSSHISNLREMVEHVHPRTLVLIDEAGTGTDPQEGGALAQAMLETLTRKGARTIATTHHGMLKVYAHEAESVENASMEFDQSTLSPTYSLRIGIPGSSYAFEIGQRMGLDESVLERAREIAGSGKTDLEALIGTFETRNQALQEQLDEARREARVARQQREEYESRKRKLDKEREKIRQQALEEAERIVEGANARIERVIREIKEAEAEKEATKKARGDFEEYKEEIEETAAEKEESEDPQEKQEPAPPAAAESNGSAREDVDLGGPVEEGDVVTLDGGSTQMEVLEREENEAIIAAGSMHMRVDVNRLAKVGGRRRQHTSVGNISTSSADEVASLKAKRRIDLRGQRVEEALQVVEQMVDEAIAANLSQIEILHGKGTGALRSAIHEYLAGRPEVSSYDEAPWNEGGAGVTYVQLA